MGDCFIISRENIQNRRAAAQRRPEAGSTQPDPEPEGSSAAEAGGWIHLYMELTEIHINTRQSMELREGK